MEAGKTLCLSNVKKKHAYHTDIHVRQMNANSDFSSSELKCRFVSEMSQQLLDRLL